MICANCGQEFFTPKHPHAKYCSRRECQLARKNLWGKQKRLSDSAWAEKIRAYNRKNYAVNPEPKLARENERNRKKRLLSKLDAAYKNKHHKPFCMWCGKYFKPKYKGEKYCSEECYSHSPFRILCQSNPRVLKYFQRLIERD